MAKYTIFRHNRQIKYSHLKLKHLSHGQVMRNKALFGAPKLRKQVFGRAHFWDIWLWRQTRGEGSFFMNINPTVLASEDKSWHQRELKIYLFFLILFLYIYFPTAKKKGCKTKSEYLICKIFGSADKERVRIS